MGKLVFVKKLGCFVDFLFVYWFIVLFDEVGKVFERIILNCFVVYLFGFGLDFVDG